MAYGSFKYKLGQKYYYCKKCLDYNLLKSDHSFVCSVCGLVVESSKGLVKPKALFVDRLGLEFVVRRYFWCPSCRGHRLQYHRKRKKYICPKCHITIQNKKELRKLQIERGLK